MSCRAFVLSAVFLTAAVAQAPEPTGIDFSRSYTRSYSLVAGKAVEVAVGLPAPSKLPANGRIAVEWAGYRKVLHALDARTGKLVWSTPLSEVPGHNNTSGVLAAHGKIITGLTGCGRIPAKDHCYISAYDAQTGKRVWKFVTVALTGEPNGDSWGGLPDEKFRMAPCPAGRPVRKS